MQPCAVRSQRRPDRQRAGIVVRIGLLLPAPGIDDLPEISFLEQEADADRRHPEIAGGLQIVAGQHSEAAGVKRQRGAEPELHAEIGDAAQRGAGIACGEPAGHSEIGVARLDQKLQLGGETRVGGEGAELALGRILQDRPGVARLRPGIGVDPLPQRVRLMTPGPAQIDGKTGERGERFGEIAGQESRHGGLALRKIVGDTTIP